MKNDAKTTYLLSATDLKLNSRRVDEALSILARVRESLTTSEGKCSACGAQHADSWPERQLARELDATVSKLSGWAVAMKAAAHARREEYERLNVLAEPEADER